MPAAFKNLASRILNDKSYREIIGGGAGNFSIRVLGIIVGYFFIFLISRLYGPDVLGAYTLSVTVLMIFTVIGRMGMDTAIVKHFAQSAQNNRSDIIKEVYIKTLYVIIPVGLILSVILYLSADIIAVNVFHKPRLIPYLKVMSFAVLPMVMRYITSECYRGLRKFTLYAYSQNVSYFLYGSVILGGLSLFMNNDLVPNIAYTISLIILMISASVMVYKRINQGTTVRSDQHTVSSLVLFALPMMLTGSLVLISGWINTIILGIYESESTVGIYSVVLKISTLTSFVLLSINSISAPRFAQLHAAGDIKELKNYTSKTASVIFFTTLPVFIFIIIFRKYLLLIFGETFELGSGALLIVMAGQFFNFFAGSVGHYLNMTGYQKQMRNIVAFSAGINIFLCYILIPKYGIMGSAIANAAFMATWNLIAMIYIKQKFGVRTYFWPLKTE